MLYLHVPMPITVRVKVGHLCPYLVTARTVLVLTFKALSDLHSECNPAPTIAVSRMTYSTAGSAGQPQAFLLAMCRW